MQILTGQIIYKTFAEGTKSECQRPFVFLKNGSQILLYSQPQRNSKKDMAVCPNCGATIAEDESFCTECGTSL